MSGVRTVSLLQTLLALSDGAPYDYLLLLQLARLACCYWQEVGLLYLMIQMMSGKKTKKLRLRVTPLVIHQ